MTFDYTKIEKVEVSGIDPKDYPLFCDAYIASATYKGVDMTTEQLEVLNQDMDFVHQSVYNQLF